MKAHDNHCSCNTFRSKTLVRARCPYAHDIIVSSVSSTNSSIHSSTFSSSLVSSTTLWTSFPLAFLASANRAVFRDRQASHSAISRCRRASFSAEPRFSSAASSSSKARENSLSSRLTLCRASLERRVGGRGRQRNCLNLSSWLETSSDPLKSQILYPGSG